MQQAVLLGLPEAHLLAARLTLVQVAALQVEPLVAQSMQLEAQQVALPAGLAVLWVPQELPGLQLVVALEQVAVRLVPLASAQAVSLVVPSALSEAQLPGAVA